jgi:RNA polymerase sigma factor (sigma-70 family)
MDLHISYKATKTPALEHEFQSQVQKLSRRLQVFRPKLLHLHASVETNSAREGTVVALNLRLPSGQLAAEESGTPPAAAVKAAFAELLKQLTKHKDQLRGPRHRRPETKAAAFESTVAAVHPAKVSNRAVNSWVDANLDRLARFIARELRHRETSGHMAAGALSVEEVMDEAIAMALGDGEERPELLSLERWLYHLAKRAMAHLERAGAPISAVHLEDSVRKVNVRASDEPQLQFHQPDEIMLEENVIADRSVATPEELLYSDEMVAMLETALGGARPEEREAFILSVLEGFTVKEIAVIAEKPAREIEAHLVAARERLRKALPQSTPWRDRLLRSRTA